MRLCHVPQMLSLCVCTSWKNLLYLHSLHKVREARPQKHQMIRDALGFEIVSPRYDTNTKFCFHTWQVFGAECSQENSVQCMEKIAF